MEVKDIFSDEQLRFYKEALALLNEHEIPFLLGGAFALRHYTGISRNTKDIDIFCKAGDHQKVLKLFGEHGFEIELTDARWLAKVFHKGYFIDIIFNTTNNLCPVDDSWFTEANKITLFDLNVLCVAPEDLIWVKLYIQDRYRFDGADIHHTILRTEGKLNWERLLWRMEQHWHLLLSHLLTFQFVYPSERDLVPKHVFDELLEKAKEQFTIPPSKNKICLGPLIDHSSYEIDIQEWDFKALTLKTL